MQGKTLVAEPPNYDSYARRHEAGEERAPVLCAAPNRAVRWTMLLGARRRTVARVIDKEKSAQFGDRTLAQATEPTPVTYPDSMSRRAFTPDDEALLREVVAKHRPDLLPLLEEAATGLVLTVSEANKLQDAVADEFGATPLDELGGLTEAGIRLDHLIDSVAHASLTQSRP